MTDWPSWLDERLQALYIRELEDLGVEFEVCLRESYGYVVGRLADDDDYWFELHLHEPPVDYSTYGRYRHQMPVGRPRRGSLNAVLAYALTELRERREP